jgi:hypothetical protein
MPNEIDGNIFFHKCQNPPKDIKNLFRPGAGSENGYVILFFGAFPACCFPNTV